MAGCHDMLKGYELAVGNSDWKPPDSWAIQEVSDEESSNETSDSEQTPPPRNTPPSNTAGQDVRPPRRNARLRKA